MPQSVGVGDTYTLQLPESLRQRYERVKEVEGMTYPSDAMKQALYEWIQDWEQTQALKALARDRQILEDLPDRVREALLDELE